MRALRARGYTWRELWASPVHVGVPNQRTRYFLLARRGRPFAPPPPQLAPLVLEADLLPPIGILSDGSRDKSDAPALPPPRGEPSAALQADCAPLSAYLLGPSSADLADLAVPSRLLERYAGHFDVVCRESRRSRCFTKNYTRYAKGTGSVVAEAPSAQPSATPSAERWSLGELQALSPRFFAPREIANLHGFPRDFEFAPGVSNKKQYELLGNSLSVDVVVALLDWLLRDADETAGESIRYALATTRIIYDDEAYDVLT